MRNAMPAGCIAVALMICLFAGSPCVCGATTPAIVDFHITNPNQMWPATPNGTLGWAFRPTVDVVVTHLGFYDHEGDGLNFVHRIGLWDAAGQPLASSQLLIGSHAPLVGSYRYAAIDPIVLLAGKEYVIGASVWSGNVNSGTEYPAPDLLPSYDVDPFSVVVASALEVVSGARIYPEYLLPVDPGSPIQGIDPNSHIFGPQLPLTFPSVDVPGGSFFAPNFQFTVVPEPSSLAVLLSVSAFLAMRRKSRAT